MSSSKKTVFVSALFGAAMTVGCSQPSNPAQSGDHAAAAAPVPTAPAPAPAAASGPVEPPSPKLQPLVAQDMQPDSIASAESCNIEAVGSSVFGADPITLTEKSTMVGGWFLSAISKKSGVPARLELINEAGTAGWQMPVYATLARPDVVSSMGGADARNIGFSQAIDLSPVPAGRYQIVVTFNDGGQSYSCTKGRMIVIQ